MKSPLVVLLTALAAAGVCAPSAAATDSMLSGFVFDQLGEPLRGAEINVRDATGGKRTATSDARGRFSMLSFDIAPRTISVAGYEPRSMPCEIPAGASARIVMQFVPIDSGAARGSTSDSLRLRTIVDRCTVWPETQDRYVL